MAPPNLKDALESAVKKLLEEEEAIGGADMYCYANTVAAGFVEIQALRVKRVRFDRICKSFEQSGLLPENASVHSFRQAFLREKARREKTGGHTAQGTKICGAKVGESGAKASEEETKILQRPAPRAPLVPTVPGKTAESGTGLDVKPDNTFTIRPVDLDDMPKM